MAFARSGVAKFFAVGALVLLALYVIGGHSSGEQVAKPSMDHADEINPRLDGWQYSVERDEMRGTATRIAKLQADNYNPYITPTLTLWKGQNGRTGAQLEGPLVVGSIGVQCDPQVMTVAVKIDDGAIRNLRCQMGMSVGIENTLVGLLKGSKHMILEVGGATDGRQQYKFSTAGLTL